MKVTVLIEPTSAGRFSARAGEPFNASAEGASADDAINQLTSLLRQRVQEGARIATIDLGNGSPEPAPLHLEPIPEEDWFFKAMNEAIAENREREDKAEP